MKAPEWLRKNANKYERDEAIKLCARECSIKVRSAEKSYVSMFGKTRGYNKTRKFVGLSENDLRGRHDPVYQTQQAVEKLEEGVFIPRSQFREEMCKLTPAKFTGIEDRDEFKKYQGKALNGDSIYWSHPKSIRKMISDHVLQEV